MTGKVCTRCDRWTPRAEFHNDRMKPDGKRPDCKACVSVQAATRYARNPEKINAATVATREQNRAPSRAWSLAYYRKNRDAINAKRKEKRDARKKSRCTTNP